jgi:alanine-glyoxylate transaminase/serine-glyoxylate transaminase/serine-pyruvate transaminase
MAQRSLLMIPGPVEVSPGVLAAFSTPPPGHTAPALIAAFGEALERMRRVWSAEPSSQPFVLGGGGTAAMDMAVANLVSPGDRVVVVKTGYFSDRMAEMLRRQGAATLEIGAEPGGASSPGEVREALAADRAAGAAPCRALFATHVDTSTGVRSDPAPLARLAREHGMIAVFDGVCAAGGERFDMAAWDADVYLTASQKALGLPPGLALMVVSPRALAARAARRGSLPPMYLDWEVWRPVMRAYEERRAAYFSTPPTNLVLALAAGLAEIESDGMAARIARHAAAAAALRTAWKALGLRLLPVREDLAADTLSALLLPASLPASAAAALPIRAALSAAGTSPPAAAGAGPPAAGSAGADAPAVVARIAAHGVTVATGLLPELRNHYFRVGHMGWVAGRPELLRRTVAAVASGLRECGLGAGEQAEKQALAALDQLPAWEAPAAAAEVSP